MFNSYVSHYQRVTQGNPWTALPYPLGIPLASLAWEWGTRESPQQHLWAAMGLTSRFLWGTGGNRPAAKTIQKPMVKPFKTIQSHPEPSKTIQKPWYWLIWLVDLHQTWRWEWDVLTRPLWNTADIILAPKDSHHQGWAPLRHMKKQDILWNKHHSSGLNLTWSTWTVHIC